MKPLLRRPRRHVLLSGRQWLRRIIYWAGAALIGLTAIAFACLADQVDLLRRALTGPAPWLMLVVAPVSLGLSAWLTRRWFPGAQGSGIPQVIASLHMTASRDVDRVLSLRIALGKILLTLLGLFGGASIGREGPTVQVGATLMHSIGSRVGLHDVTTRRALVLAGGAAGVSAAFNTPLAGIVFAIEELSHSFESRTSGTMLTAVVLSGLTSLALVGNYTYFGHTDAALPAGLAWLAAPACGVAGGLTGGLFSLLLLRAGRGLPGPLGRLRSGSPVLFAALCGLLLALIGLLSHGATYGTGYYQARRIIEGQASLPAGFFAMKFAASLVSYCSGIPGGIFAPSLAVGAGIGGSIARFLPHVAPGMVVLLGMAGYFAGVVQAPLTATVIVMEMTDNQGITVALLATSFIAFAVSRLICPEALYGALARDFLRVQDLTDAAKPSTATEPEPEEVATTAPGPVGAVMSRSLHVPRPVTQNCDSKDE